MQKHRDGFAQARAAFDASPESEGNSLATHLLICLENELLQKPAVPAQPDLKPAGVKTVVESFQEAYQRLNPVKKPNHT